MSKIGLYFGSFNPIHIGHIIIAGYMTEFTEIDEIWFVVSPHNPLKRKETLLDDYQRLHMVNLGIGNNERMRASDIEFRLPVPSYTIHTLAYLHEKYSRHEFCLVMGEDNLYTLHKWKNAAELVKKYEIYVYPRPGAKRPSSALLDSLLGTAVIHRVKAPFMDISGTFIRYGVKRKKDMSYYLPGPVWKYIQEMHFYEK